MKKLNFLLITLLIMTTVSWSQVVRFVDTTKAGSGSEAIVPVSQVSPLPVVVYATIANDSDYIKKSEFNDTGYVKTTGDTITGDYQWRGPGFDEFTLKKYTNFGDFSSLYFLSAEVPYDEFPYQIMFRLNPISGMMLNVEGDGGTYIEASSTFLSLVQAGGEIYFNNKKYIPTDPSYSARINQSGTNAPSATVLKNQLPFTPTYHYTSTGFYSLAIPNGRPEVWADYLITCSSSYYHPNQFVQITMENQSLYIKTYQIIYNGGGLIAEPINNVLNNFYLKIEKVY